MLTTELYNQGFTLGTWNFFKASHGKGAPDGVGGLLKRTADRLVSQGEDISTAKHIFNALVNTNTAVKIFYIEEATVERPYSRCHNDSRCTMHYADSPGHHASTRKLTYCDVSCLCSTRQILQCQCYQAKAFNFKVNSAVPALHQDQPDLEVQWERDDIVGQWCVIRYDDEVYPGTIVEVKTIIQIILGLNPREPGEQLPASRSLRPTKLRRDQTGTFGRYNTQCRKQAAGKRYLTARTFANILWLIHVGLRWAALKIGCTECSPASICRWMILTGFKLNRYKGDIVLPYAVMKYDSLYQTMSEYADIIAIVDEKTPTSEF
ncbi:hypothetical protein DPEC_G00067670 [Dallia pectoralis]|uniref:Uncharacterized protein n=1 Tax=Dallia pectoralis TaxID=75939 RepID=A0ACC2H271_DALPE|nr:hypothetical protein DPEC_G00067670 [Dallia pectoralis]